MIYYQPHLPIPPNHPAGFCYPGGRVDVIGFPTIPSLLAMPKVFPVHQRYAECSSPVIEQLKSGYVAIGFCAQDARVDPATTMPPCTLDPQLANTGVVRACADRCHLEPHKLCQPCSDQSRLLLLNGLPDWFTNKQIAKSRAFLCAPCSAQEVQQAVLRAEAEAALQRNPGHLATTKQASDLGHITNQMTRYHNNTSFPVATPPILDSLAQALAGNASSTYRSAKQLFRCSCAKLITADLCVGHRLFRAEQFLEQVRCLGEWTQYRYSLRIQDHRPCPRCMERVGVDAHNFSGKAGGADLPTVHWICMCCQEIVSMTRSEFIQQGGGLGQENSKKLAEMMRGLGF